MNYLIFDTETTGLPLWKNPLSDPRQPHLVQLAALLCNSDGVVQGKVNEIVKPEGWDRPADVAKIHGITNEIANERGNSFSSVLAAFAHLLRQADALVAHNISFDAKTMNIAFLRLAGHEMPLSGKQMHCTMRVATPIVKELHAKPRHAEDYKWPRLAKCMDHFFNEELIGAHNAMVDVQATHKLFFHLKDVEQVIAA
ncbi:MAG: 3'-5' exonuclease [Pseudomonadota bacterium]